MSFSMINLRPAIQEAPQMSDRNIAESAYDLFQDDLFSTSSFY